MGQCIKCGRETPHAYTYWTGNALDRKTCTNLLKHTAFLCNKHAMAAPIVGFGIYAALYAAGAVTAGMQSNLVYIIFYGVLAAFGFAALLYSLVVVLRDKAFPFYVSQSAAERRIIKILRKQAPGKNYFAPSDYH